MRSAHAASGNAALERTTTLIIFGVKLTPDLRLHIIIVTMHRHPTIQSYRVSATSGMPSEIHRRKSYPCFVQPFKNLPVLPVLGVCCLHHRMDRLQLLHVRTVLEHLASLSHSRVAAVSALDCEL